MLRKRLLYLAQLSAVGIGGYYVGQNKDTFNIIRDEDSIIVDGKRIRNMPGLPVFGTVSAATPFTDSSAPKDRISQIMKYGFPGLDNVRSYDDFVLSYDRRNRVPHWVFEHLTKEHVAKNDAVDRSKCEFTPDESIHPFFRSQNADYKRSGFDRGHMAAAGNHRLAQKHVDQTFFLSNMAPQMYHHKTSWIEIVCLLCQYFQILITLPNQTIVVQSLLFADRLKVGEGFNRSAWNNLEKHVRKLTKVYDNVYCCTGPLYLPRRESDGKFYVHYQVIGANTVAVPTHFYKVVVGEAPDGSLDMEAYVMPNQKIPDNTPVSSFMVPPETVEKAAGLLFFDKIHRSKLNRINGKKV